MASSSRYTPPPPSQPPLPSPLPSFPLRLVSDEDRAWLGHQVVELNEKHFKEKASRVLGIDKQDDTSLLNALRGLMFGDFMTPGAGAARKGWGEALMACLVNKKSSLILCP